MFITIQFELSYLLTVNLFQSLNEISDLSFSIKNVSYFSHLRKSQLHKPHRDFKKVFHGIYVLLLQQPQVQNLSARDLLSHIRILRLIHFN